MPKVSIIIPVYGVEMYIERCARSLLKQTLDDIEYLFVDDCSPDNSVEILKQILEDFPFRKKQVKIHKMEKNSGQALVRQWGMKNATGEYVIHCDGDDWVDVDMYKVMYEEAKNKKADVVVCDYCIASDNGKNYVVRGCHATENEEFVENLLLQRDSWSLCNKLFKRTTYSNKPISYPIGAMGEDMVICLQLLLNSKKLVYVNKPFYYYYTNTNSITKKQSKDAIIKRFQQSVANASILLDICKQWNLYDKYKEDIDSILLNKKNLLRPLIGEREYYDIWKNTFPEINISILWNKKVSLKIKIKHILTFFKLYKQ